MYIVDKLLYTVYNADVVSASDYRDDRENRGGLARIDQSVLADRVYKTLRAAILSGEFEPGERLVESQIADQIGVSRAPVRTAISRLDSEGLVDLFPRRGSYVTALIKQDIWEVYTLRASLERLAFKLVPERTKREEILALHQIIEEMEECVTREDQAGLSDLEWGLHEEIVRLAKHERLLSVWMSLSGQIQLLSRRVIEEEYSDLSPIPQRHKFLLDRLLNGSEEERSGAIEEHINSVAERILARFRG